jgi:putative MATE family efflux protein
LNNLKNTQHETEYASPSHDAARIEIFRSAPIPQAVANLAIPTIISQLVTMIYNLADTFFVGQMGDPRKVAAVSLVLPAYTMLTAIANLFGVGGSSVISRFLGSEQSDRARQTSTFCIFSTVAVTAIFSVLVFVFQKPFLLLLGANDETYEFASSYLIWVLVIGGVPTVLGMLFGHLVRSEGSAKQASIGMSFGGILNIILDPIFIMTFGMGVRGAAIATMISNCATVCYFLVYLYRRRGKTFISFVPREFDQELHIAGRVASVGLPASLQTLLSLTSNTVLNNLASGYGSTALAAVGIVKRIDMLPMNVTVGISQGVLPFIGYNFAAKRFNRVRQVNKFTRILAVCFSILCVAAFEIFAETIVGLFINDAETIRLGAAFLRILCLTTPVMAISYLITTMFQATGQGKRALAISLFRKTTVDVPLMFLMNRLIPLYGLLMVQPIVDTLSIGLAFALYHDFSKKLKAQSAPEDKYGLRDAVSEEKVHAGIRRTPD